MSDKTFGILEKWSLSQKSDLDAQLLRGPLLAQSVKTQDHAEGSWVQFPVSVWEFFRFGKLLYFPGLECDCSCQTIILMALTWTALNLTVEILKEHFVESLYSHRNKNNVINHLSSDERWQVPSTDAGDTFSEILPLHRKGSGR